MFLVENEFERQGKLTMVVCCFSVLFGEKSDDNVMNNMLICCMNDNIYPFRLFYVLLR